MTILTTAFANFDTYHCNFRGLVNLTWSLLLSQQTVIDFLGAGTGPDRI